MRALIAVDLAHDAERVVDVASAWVARLGGTADVLYVVDGGPLRDDPDAAMDALIGRVPEANRGPGWLLRGRPAEVLVREGARYDLVLLGTHGRAGVRRALLGSVAEHVVRHSAVPVLVIRKDEPSDPIRVLVGVDVRDAMGGAAIRAVATWLAPVRARVDVAWVEPAEGSADALDVLEVPADLVASRRARNAVRLDALRALLPGPLCGAAILANGDAATGLAELARARDLCVVFTHGRGGMERWWLGSVAEKLVRTAESSVLVLRRDADRAAAAGDHSA